jgi:hypothetical protein
LRNPSNEYSPGAFKQLCEETIQNPPEGATDQSNSWERRAELVLEQLLAKGKHYAGTDEVKLGVHDMPRLAYLEDQIIHILTFVWNLDNRTNRPVIHECVTDIVGPKPDAT